jgi:hypothetical protein
MAARARERGRASGSASARATKEHLWQLDTTSGGHGRIAVVRTRVDMVGMRAGHGHHV